LDAQTCLEILREVYRGNPFICYLDINIDAVKCGEATLSLIVDDEKHTNQYGFTHGGALESLADIALGVACATVGKRVMTLSFNMNFTLHSDARAIFPIRRAAKAGLSTECMTRLRVSRCMIEMFSI